jgi:hypothetical protein
MHNSNAGTTSPDESPAQPDNSTTVTEQTGAQPTPDNIRYDIPFATGIHDEQV